MDEAERCHRLAILDHGKLVADDSPRELCASLPGSALLIECDNPRRAQLALEGDTAIVSMAQIGAHLRVLVRNGVDARAAINARLGKAGIAAKVEPVEANLEDVFVVATQKPKTERSEASR
jgi:ABC-2 type transport system ATP-binding protein